jgi:hypothetical protein
LDPEEAEQTLAMMREAAVPALLEIEDARL